jgi:hypothetical protein
MKVVLERQYPAFHFTSRMDLTKKAPLSRGEPSPLMNAASPIPGSCQHFLRLRKLQSRKLPGQYFSIKEPVCPSARVRVAALEVVAVSE